MHPTIREEFMTARLGVRHASNERYKTMQQMFATGLKSAYRTAYVVQINY